MVLPDWKALTNINRKKLKRTTNGEKEFPIIINHWETTQLKILIYASRKKGDGNYNKRTVTESDRSKTNTGGKKEPSFGVFIHFSIDKIKISNL